MGEETDQRGEVLSLQSPSYFVEEIRLKDSKPGPTDAKFSQEVKLYVQVTL